MSLWFFISAIGMIAILPIYFWSLEHIKLQERFGKKKGTKLGDSLGLISGWGFFLFWIGIWVSPQPKFTIPVLEDPPLIVPFIDFEIPLLHLIISFPILLIAMGIAIKGVTEVTLKVAETHRPEKVISKGTYSIVRHPQYFGGLLSHLAISILLSALFSLFITPLVIIYVYIISWKEEKEMIKEFGKEYEDYMENVPMFLPRLRKNLK